MYRSLQTASAVVTKMALGKNVDPFYLNQSRIPESAPAKGSVF